MAKVWQEKDISLRELYLHLVISGFKAKLDSDDIGIKSEHGLYIHIRIDENRQYIQFSCYFRLNKNFSESNSLELLQIHNAEESIASFSLSPVGYLIVGYAMSFEFGLIAGQFMSMLRKYCNFIDQLIAEKNQNNFIVFDNPKIITTSNEKAELCNIHNDEHENMKSTA